MTTRTGENTDTAAIRRLTERMRSSDEKECETAISHLLDQVDVGVLDRAADDIDWLREQRDRIDGLEGEIKARGGLIESMKLARERETKECLDAFDRQLARIVQLEAALRDVKAEWIAPCEQWDRTNCGRCRQCKVALRVDALLSEVPSQP